MRWPIPSSTRRPVRRWRNRSSLPKYPLPRLRAYALRALAYRSHSRAELRRKLDDRAADAADAETLIEQLEELELLDDRRFAVEFARSRAFNRRYGRIRINRDLRRKGVADEHITSAIEAVFPSEDDELQLLRRRVEQRLERKRAPHDAKMFRSLYSALLRAGFRSAIIRDELFRRPEFSQLERFPGRW